MAHFTPTRASKRTSQRMDERTANAYELAIHPLFTETAYTTVCTTLAWWELVDPSNREPTGDEGDVRQAGESSGQSRRGTVDKSWWELASLP